MNYKDEKRRNLQRLGDIITKTMQSKGWNTVLTENQACVYWEDIVGEQIANKAKALRVENGVLYVKVNSSAWKQELHFMKPVILEKIRNFLDNTLIVDIKFF